MIPNKSNFKFQELTPITGVKPYVIRFWETEFPEIDPVDSDSGQKLYARKDVEAILRIKKLLFEYKLSIPEAKAALKLMREEEPVSVKSSPSTSTRDFYEVTETLKGALDLVKEIKFKQKW
jgi:DNA-binding transcriptional MerR regulator